MPFSELLFLVLFYFICRATYDFLTRSRRGPKIDGDNNTFIQNITKGNYHHAYKSPTTHQLA